MTARSSWCAAALLLSSSTLPPGCSQKCCSQTPAAADRPPTSLPFLPNSGDDKVPQLLQLTRLQALSLTQATITDQGLQELERCGS